MILSQRQLEEIAASTTKDFNRFFFGDEADKPDRSALPTPIDQFAKNYLGLRVSFARLSPDGSICGVTAYADTEYKITELGITTERNWVMLFKQYENVEELNRRVLMSLVDRILIHENHAIEIVFKYRDEYQQTLEYILGYADELDIAV